MGGVAGGAQEAVSWQGRAVGRGRRAGGQGGGGGRATQGCSGRRRQGGQVAAARTQGCAERGGGGGGRRRRRGDGGAAAPPPEEVARGARAAGEAVQDQAVPPLAHPDPGQLQDGSGLLLLARGGRRVQRGGAHPGARLAARAAGPRGHQGDGRGLLLLPEQGCGRGARPVRLPARRPASPRAARRAGSALPSARAAGAAGCGGEAAAGAQVEREGGGGEEARVDAAQARVGGRGGAAADGRQAGADRCGRRRDSPERLRAAVPRLATAAARTRSETNCRAIVEHRVCRQRGSCWCLRYARAATSRSACVEGQS
mmetsp:Transcript_34030/g.108631  ORF Transcript_34030/g.108631 Transcript_34030/m.108631 type:complete len:314 (+) Transcript_34030:285-1226(+)